MFKMNHEKELFLSYLLSTEMFSVDFQMNLKLLQIMIFMSVMIFKSPALHPWIQHYGPQ